MNTITVVYESDDEHNLTERLQELDNEVRHVQQHSEVGLVYVSHTVNQSSTFTQDERDMLHYAIQEICDQAYDWQLEDEEMEEAMRAWDELNAKITSEPIDWPEEI